MSDEAPEEPKLIIDEDWKAKVQREKEEFKQQEEEGEPSAKTTDSPETEEEPSADSSAQTLPPPPPASLTFLITTLATQAMAALGQIPGDDGKPLPVNLEYARHFIDLIDVLDDKTQGNLDEEEQQALQNTLHQLRMMFVSTSQQPAK